MKKKLFLAVLTLTGLMASTRSFADVTITTSSVPTGNIAQGSTNNVVYIAKMDVTTLPVVVNSIQFTLTGTFDNNDIPTLSVFFNATTPSLSGATQMAGNISGLFSSPHTFSSSFNFAGSQTIAAGASGYFIITANADPTATAGNTVKLDGAANPVTFGYTSAPLVINNQTDLAGIQTFSAAGVTLSSNTVLTASLAQGSTNNILYVTKMDVASLPVIVNNIQFTLTGTHDNNDLTTLSIYFNATTPTIAGATQLAGNISGLFAAPHTYSTNFNFNGPLTMAAGSSGYFIIVANIDPAATAGNTIKLNGATNPVVFSYTTAPTITNNQTDAAGIQTIAAAGVTLSSNTVLTGNLAQGSTNNILYITKMDVASLPVVVSNIQFTLTGTHDNNDMTTISVFFNAATPTLAGATQLLNVSALFAAPHTYSTNFNFNGPLPIAAGTSGYFIIVANIDPAATAGNTIKINGATNPVTFTFSTSPTITNNQTDAAGIQTIAAAGVTLSSNAVAAANLAQASTNNILYITRMDVTSLPVVVNNIQFTLTGTHDNNDMTTISVFFNAVTPTLAGATQLLNISALFAAPHAYSTNFNFNGPLPIAAGTSGYFIIVANIDPAATGGNTIKLNGAANPVTFTFTTSPSITNNQTDAAGIQTIIAAGVSLSSTAVAANNIAQGSTNNILYITKMDVTSLPVIVNNIQFTLTGTHDNNDMTSISVFFNAATPTLAGATQLLNVSALFAAPHTYSTNFNFNGPLTLAAGTSGYFIIVANIDPAATGGNTIKVNGATNPVVFSYTTAPTVTNNQTDVAGIQTIIAPGVALSSTAVAASNIGQGTTNNIIYITKMDVTTLPVIINNIQFTLTGTHDNNDLTTISVFFNAATPTLSGATQLLNVSGLFAAPHTYSTNFNTNGPLTMAAGSSGYYIIVANLAAGATTGNTIKVNGAANPVVFSYTTAPTVTNNQIDVAGVQTILAPGVTLSSPTVPATGIVQGSSNNVLYIAKMDVTVLPVVVNNIQFTLTGTHDNNDLTTLSVFYNPAIPSLAGATQLAGNISGLFAAPHTYSSNFNFNGPQSIAAGATGYFLITANLDPAATSGNTVILNGAVNPVVFSFTTAPSVTNNQTNAAGVQTISGTLPLTLKEFTGKPTNTQEVLLQWKTAGEINTKDFEVEWSNDALHFNAIAVLQAAGNSNQDLQYSYLHKMPGDGFNYYRLKMTDKDGRFTYSPIIKVAVVLSVTKMTAFPNPVTDKLVISVQAVKNETMTFLLSAADGKIIETRSFAVQKGNNQFSWNLQQLPAGTYFLTGGNNRETKQIIKE